MLTVPVYDMQGQQTGQVEIDPAVLGGEVRPALLKQAVVTYLDRQRQRSARTKRRSDVAGSTRKLYRQKGTGNARMGPIRTPQRRGGGRAFGKRVPGRARTMSKMMRRLACQNAILSKMHENNVLVIDGLHCSEPKTKLISVLLGKLGADKGCVIALNGADRNVFLSGRNIPKTEVRPLEELTAYEILRRKKLVLARPAFDRLAKGNGSATVAVRG